MVTSDMRSPWWPDTRIEALLIKHCMPVVYSIQNVTHVNGVWYKEGVVNLWCGDVILLNRGIKTTNDNPVDIRKIQDLQKLPAIQ